MASGHCPLKMRRAMGKSDLRQEKADDFQDFFTKVIPYCLTRCVLVLYSFGPILRKGSRLITVADAKTPDALFFVGLVEGWISACFQK